MGARRLVGVVVTVVLGAVVVGATTAVLAIASPSPAMLRASVHGYVSTPEGRLVRASLTLDTYPDSLAGEHGSGGGAHPDWVSYGPSTSLWVPAHALVTVTIRQYDTGGTILNPFFASARGTVGGVEWVNGRRVGGVDPNNIGHTFTIHTFPTDQTSLFVNVPLPAVPASAPNLANGYPRPVIVTFQFVTGGPGRYVWQCEYPCGVGVAGFGGPMSTQGYMAGTLTVG